MLQSGHMTTDQCDLVLSIASDDYSEKVSQRILRLADDQTRSHSSPPFDDPQLEQLDWTPMETSPMGSPKPLQVLWSKWYWELAKPKPSRISRPEPSTSHHALASHVRYFGYPSKIGPSSTLVNMGGRTM